MRFSTLVVLTVFGASGAIAADEALNYAPVMLSPIAGVYVADATVQAVRQSVVSAQVPGRVVQLAVRAGDTVKAGQLIARLDDRELGAAEASSQAATLEAQANLARAELDYKRSQELASRNFISRSALDQAESVAKASRARVEAMRAGVGAASATRSHALITAPYDGTVESTQVEVGDMAMPGKPIVTLFQPGALRVVAFVPEAEIAAVRAGIARQAPAVELGGKTIAGRQVTILPSADPGTRTTEIRVDLPATAPAVPGQFARLRLGVGEQPRLSIPAAAVLRRGELSAVYVKTSEGLIQQRQVRVGEALADGRVEILAGVKPGETVALDPVRAGIALSAKHANK